MPLLTIAYLFNYLDRTSLGFAALTMNQQLGLTAGQFGLAAGIFFLGYSTFEIPSNLMLYRFGARRWLARIMISWGIVSAATAFVVGPNSFYGLRLLLGITEAGFFPGVTFFLAAWFPAQYRTRMLAWFLVGIPLSSLVGGPVCGMLLQMDGIWGLAGWQWLFLLVSLPCIPLGLLTLRLLADHPRGRDLADPGGARCAERRARLRSAGTPACFVVGGLEGYARADSAPRSSSASRWDPTASASGCR